MASHMQTSPTSSLNMNSSICLVGAGNMGGAMLGGWLKGGFDPKLITVIDPAPPAPMAELIGQYGVKHVTTADQAESCDIIIVAVKPQMMDAVLPGLTHLVSGENAMLSVAAGTTIGQLSNPFQSVSPRVIRAMPNTPSMVQRGITVCVANELVSEEQKHAVGQLLAAVGDVEWVEDEGLMDAVTGVSGSGPAYVFHLAEALTEAGVAAGLPAALAGRLAQATVCGAGELMRQSDLSPATLRENVTSPNGTTAAALAVLMADDGFPDLLKRAVLAATNRSVELSDEGK